MTNHCNRTQHNSFHQDMKFIFDTSNESVPLSRKRTRQSDLEDSEACHKVQKIPTASIDTKWSEFSGSGASASTANSTALAERLPPTILRHSPNKATEAQQDPTKKKRVRFSSSSSIHILRRHGSAENQYYSREERAKFKLDQVRVAGLIREGLARNPALLDDCPEERVGLEEWIEGIRHVRNNQIQKKKTIRNVVVAWRLLREEISKPKVPGLGLCEETVAKQIAALYENACRKSVTRANRRGSVVHKIGF